jgi:hypothetical protein
MLQELLPRWWIGGTSTTYGGIEKYYWNSDFPSVALDRYPMNFKTYSPAFGGASMAATETGYSTWKYGQSERMQARYMPRIFLENFRLGIKRTYSYELVDEFVDPTGDNREAHFGLIRQDLTPKPAYFAIQSLLNAIGDPAPRSNELAGLRYELEVDAPDGYDPRYLHHVAFEKGDGSVVLALWHEVSGDDTTGLNATPRRAIREVSHPPMSVTLKLASGSGISNVKMIDDRGQLVLRPSNKSSDGIYTFAVPDQVTLVSIPAAK